MLYQMTKFTKSGYTAEILTYYHLRCHLLCALQSEGTTLILDEVMSD
jgi:hypothetical protein